MHAVYGQFDSIYNVYVESDGIPRQGNIRLRMEELNAGNLGDIQGAMRSLYGKLPEDWGKLNSLLQGSKGNIGSYHPSPSLVLSSTTVSCTTVSSIPGEHNGKCTVNVTSNFDSQFVREIPFDLHTGSGGVCTFSEDYSS